MTVCDMKGLAHDELTKNYYSTLKLLQSFSFESLSSLFQMQAAGFIQKKSNDRCISNYLLSISTLRKLASGEHTGIFS